MLRTRALLILGLGLAGLCVAMPARAMTSIKDIVDHPDDWANAQVTVVGTVVELSLGYKGQSFYTLAGRRPADQHREPEPGPNGGRPSPGERQGRSPAAGRGVRLPAGHRRERTAVGAVEARSPSPPSRTWRSPVVSEEVKSAA